MTSFGEAIVTIAVAIVGIAILAVLVSPQAQTANVITSAGRAFSSAIGAATGPVMSGFGASNASPQIRSNWY
jgi:hypothetical protein